MRFLLIFSILLLTGCETDLGASTSLTKIEGEQETFKVIDGKYKHTPKTTEQDGTVYQVDEYVTPKGEVGYQIYFYNIDGSIESKGYGPEATDRTWIKTPPIVIPTST